jgi:hypothetical protein
MRPGRELEGLPLGEVGAMLEVRCGWAPETLWLVPDGRDKAFLRRKGVVAGRVWTAAELAPLVPEPFVNPLTGHLERGHLADVLRALEAEIIATRDPAPLYLPQARRYGPRAGLLLLLREHGVVSTTGLHRALAPQPRGAVRASLAALVAEGHVMRVPWRGTRARMWGLAEDYA